MGTILIGYDVEWRGEGEVTPHFLEQARSLHNRLGIPATLFLVGQTLERWIRHFQAIAQDPLFDLQQHTYSWLARLRHPRRGAGLGGSGRLRGLGEAVS